MPLPFIILGAAVAAGITGVVNGGSGIAKINSASEQINQAKKKYDSAMESLKYRENATKEELEELGKLKAQVGADLKRFVVVFEKIKNRPHFSSSKVDDYSLPKETIEEIKQISLSSIELLGSGVAMAGAGALAGLAAWGGTMTLGVASTGAAIGSLSGVAATNATLAALGGGSLAAGGGGMALGSAVLTGAIAGPIIAVGGLLLNAKGDESVKKAEEACKKVDTAIDSIDTAKSFLTKLSVLSFKMRKEMLQVYELYKKQICIMEYLVEKDDNYNNYTDQEKKVVANNIMIVKLLVDLIKTPLLKRVNDDNIPQEKVVEEALKKSQEIRKKVA